MDNKEALTRTILPSCFGLCTYLAKVKPDLRQIIEDYPEFAKPMIQQDLISLLFEATTDALAAVSSDGKVLANNFAALKWLPQLNLRELFNEAQRQGFNQPGKFIVLEPSPFPQADMKVNWLGSNQNKVLISIREHFGNLAQGRTSSPDAVSGHNKQGLFQPFGLDQQQEIPRGANLYQGSTSFTTYRANTSDSNSSQTYTPPQPTFLEEACQVGELGAFYINLEAGITNWTPAMFDLLGIPQVANPTMALLERYIHSDYRKQVMGKLYNAINEGEYFEDHFLVTHPDDASLCSLHIKAKVKRDSNGAAISVVGVLYAGVTNLDQQRLTDAEASMIKQASDEINNLTQVIAQDVKAPISSIDRIIDEIEEELGPLVSPHSKAQLDIVRGIAKRVDTMLDGLIVYAQSTKNNNDLTWIDTEQLVVNCLEYLQVGHNVRVELPQIWPTIFQNKWPISQILNNLLSNAIGFNHNDKPLLKIGLIAQADGISLTVQDNGPGIPPEHLEHVFDMFYTGNNRTKGSGVGLSIVRKILGNIGGSIQLTSNVHTGTIATAFIPCQVGPPAPRTLDSKAFRARA